MERPRVQPAITGLFAVAHKAATVASRAVSEAAS
jgi:hypothetical protein